MKFELFDNCELQEKYQTAFDPSFYSIETDIILEIFDGPTQTDSRMTSENILCDVTSVLPNDSNMHNFTETVRTQPLLLQALLVKNNALMPDYN